MFETIISNARIVDGTGAPWFRADLGLDDGKIVAVGRLASHEAKQRIEAKDRVVSPGFIEIHGHSDATLLINPRAESSVHQGVTTECTGNCGYSLFPVTENNREMISNQFSSFVPDFEITWRSLEELGSVYASRGLAVNLVPLVGHNTIRAAIKGPVMDPPTEEELREMQSLITEAMSQGARGLSSGLEYPPGSAADTGELIALASAVSPFNGRYVSHIRNRDVRYLEAIQEALAIGRQTGTAVQISHNVAKIGAPDGVMQQVLDLIVQAREEGLDAAFDLGAYLGGQTTPLASLPPWALDGGPEKTLRCLADPETRARMKAYEYPIWRIIKLGLWDKVRVAAARNNRDLIGQTFAEIARKQRKDPYDVLFDLLLSEGGGFYDVMWEGEIYTSENRDLVLKHPLSSVCCDGRTLAPYGPLAQRDYHHVYSWMPYLLRHHVRERKLLSLEEAVRKVTSSPAARLGLSDRGVIRESLAADLVIFDPETIQDRATLEDPHLYPEGIQAVFVNGRLVCENGEHTGALPGRILT